MLDPADGRANAYAAPGGASAASLAALAGALRGRAAAATLSSYDPACDVDGRVAAAAIAAATALLARAAA